MPHKSQRQQTGSDDGVFPPPVELDEVGVQVSVAELWEGADVSGGDKTSHTDDTPVVRLLQKKHNLCHNLKK